MSACAIKTNMHAHTHTHIHTLMVWVATQGAIKKNQVQLLLVLLMNTLTWISVNIKQVGQRWPYKWISVHLQTNSVMV